MFEKWPFSNFHDLNLNWIIDYVKEAKETLAGFEAKIVDGIVNKVNGKTGNVTLTASDVGAVPTSTTLTNTVNTKSGNVTLTGQDILTNSTSGQTVEYALNQKYSADNVPPYPVTSVNGETGDVTIDAGDIGALPDTTQIVNSVNGLSGSVKLTGTNLNAGDSNSQTIETALKTKYSADNVPPYPVDSVNGKTDDVVLTGDDINISADNTATVSTLANTIVGAEDTSEDIASLSQDTLAELYNSGNRLIYPPDTDDISKAWFIEKVGDTYTVYTLRGSQAVAYVTSSPFLLTSDEKKALWDKGNRILIWFGSTSSDLAYSRWYLTRTTSGTVNVVKFNDSLQKIWRPNSASTASVVGGNKYTIILYDSSTEGVQGVASDIPAGQTVKGDKYITTNTQNGISIYNPQTTNSNLIVQASRTGVSSSSDRWDFLYTNTGTTDIEASEARINLFNVVATLDTTMTWNTAESVDDTAGNVISVNDKTGAVTLTGEDIAVSASESTPLSATAYRVISIDLTSTSERTYTLQHGAYYISIHLGNIQNDSQNLSYQIVRANIVTTSPYVLQGVVTTNSSATLAGSIHIGSTLVINTPFARSGTITYAYAFIYVPISSTITIPAASSDTST